MPAYCAPWPVNRNATFGRSPAPIVPSRHARRPLAARRTPRSVARSLAAVESATTARRCARCARPALAVKHDVGRATASAARRGGRAYRAASSRSAGVGRAPTARAGAAAGSGAGAGGQPAAPPRAHVRVGAAEAERADAGAARAARRAATASRDVGHRDRQPRPGDVAGSACVKCRCGGISRAAARAPP